MSAFKQSLACVMYKERDLFCTEVLFDYSYRAV